MVAYSFKARFAEPILAGTKRQTIRAVGKRRHARPGDKLQLYTGMRTSYCRLIAGSVCDAVWPVTIDWRMFDDIPLPRVIIDGRPLRRELVIMNAFAQADGFRDVVEMREFWKRNHRGVDHFEGLMIQWRALTRTESRTMEPGVIRGLP